MNTDPVLSVFAFILSAFVCTMLICLTITIFTSKPSVRYTKNCKNGSLNCQHDELSGIKLCSALSNLTKLDVLQWTRTQTQDAVVLEAFGADAFWTIRILKNDNEACIESVHVCQLRLPMYVNKSSVVFLEFMKIVLVQEMLRKSKDRKTILKFVHTEFNKWRNDYV